MGHRIQETTGLQVLLLLLTLALMCNAKISREDLPGRDICGKPYNLDVHTLIKDGRSAKLGEYTWIANIGYTQSPTGGTLKWLCEGNLITDRYVVTLAHCLHSSTLNRIRLYVTKVRLGELDFNPDVDDKATPTDFDIEKITYHEDYNNLRKENDIGLIKLKDKVTYTDLIRPICLPTPEFQENPFVGYTPTIAGWELSGYHIPSGDTRLQVLEVEIMDTDSCRTNMTSVPILRNVTIDHRVVCATSPHKFACKVRSGGAMMLRRKIDKSVSDHFGNFFLIGMSSYGPDCHTGAYSTIFTRVSEFMDWISNNVDK